MADKIRGITIQLTGDASGLATALKSVNKDIKNTQDNLKDTQKLLKFDPGNVTLLKQKQQQLNQAIDQTKNKLEELKSHQGDMSAQLKSGKITQEVYDAYQREIIDTKEKLKSLKNEHNSFGSVTKQVLEEAASKLKYYGQKISEIGADFTKYLTVPITAVGGASIAAFNEVDAAMDTVATKTGASGDALKGMQDVVESVATTVPTDLQTAGDAVGEVNTRFKATGDELNSLSTTFVKFADINKTDVTTSVDQASMAMKAYNLTNADTEGFLGQVTKAAQDTGVTVDVLMDSLSKNGATMRSMNLDASASITLLSNFSEAGIDDETALKAMSKAAQKYSKDGQDVSEGMKNLVQGVKDGTISYQDLADTVGTKNALAFQDMAKSGRLSLDNLGTSLNDYSTKVSDTFSNTEDPIDKAKETFNQLKLTGAELGATIGTVVAPMLEKATEFLKKLKEKYDQLSPQQQEMIVKIALIAAAIGPVLAILGPIISGIGAVIGAVGMLFSPIGLIVAAIGGVIAIGVLLWKNWDTIKEKMNQLKENLQQKWDDIKNGIHDKVESIKDNVKDKFDSIKNTIQDKIQNAKDKTSQILGDMKKSYDDNGGGIKGIMAGYMTGMKDTWGAGMDKLNDLSGGRLGDIKKKFTDKFDEIKQNVSNSIEKIKGFFNFDWHLPNIKLPHFGISGSFSLNPPSIPHLSVDWYDKGGIFNSPSIIGVGEKRPEFVGALDDLRRIVRDETNANSSVINVGDITVYASPNHDEKKIADDVLDELQNRVDQKRMAFGGNL
jgi:TP901 family phage tail tape measure protein